MQAASLPSVGIWRTGHRQPAFTSTELSELIPNIREPIHVLRERYDGGRIGVAPAGDVITQEQVNGVPTYPLLATLPAMYPEWLGDRAFTEVHGIRFPYVAGAMANGIATTDLVIAMAENGMLGFFGAAGLHPDRISRELDVLEERLGDRLPWGSNLIHAPNEPAIEARTVELYLKRGVRKVSASAYMALTPMVVHYAYSGVHTTPDGRIVRPNALFAKISRPEVARRFMSPPPKEMLDKLVAEGKLTSTEAELAMRLPVAEDYIVEADSGGHTDNQTLTALFPIILRLREEMQNTYRYTRPIRLGAAGGIGTPSAAAAAFALGASFVLTGSVNQGAVESGLSPFGRQLLSTATLADVVMAPAADMFELGVKVQVLKRGTMFGVRAHKLYDIYSTYEGLHAIPANEKAQLERMFQMSTDEVWALTEKFWSERDPAEVARANRDSKHKMALCFRWYLGLSSRWAISGDPQRKMDYQIWCGPAMGAFNDWVRGSFLEPVEARTAVQIARNLLEGAAVITRAQQLRSFGVPVPSSAFDFAPRPLA